MNTTFDVLLIVTFFFAYPVSYINCLCLILDNEFYAPKFILKIS